MTQSYNRYTYAMNNPLVYTDPDGNFWNLVIGAAVGGLSYTLGVAFSNGGFKNWNWMGFSYSVVLGVMTAGFASEVGGGLAAASNLTPLAKGAIQAGAYAAWGGTTSYLSGGDFLSGAIGGAAGSIVGSFLTPLTGNMNGFWSGTTTIGASALVGGVSAEFTGGDFWTGAMISGLVAGFNHMGHMMLDNMEKMAKNLEEIIDVLYRYKTDDVISAEDIAKLNPEKLSLAPRGISSLTRTDDGFRVKLTWLGRTMLKASGTKIADNSLIKVQEQYLVKDRIFHVYSPGNQIKFGGKTVNFDLYINNNKFSIYKNFKNSYVPW